MISQNIKSLRMQKGLTQKELADLLHVTSQAVSRWEKGAVEPSVDTISKMASIFEVTTDEIIDGPDKKTKSEMITQIKEKVLIKQEKPVLTICENCKRPIYESEEIVTNKNFHNISPATTNYICIDCDKKIKAKLKKEAIDYGVSQRKKSFIWASIIALLMLSFGIYYAIIENTDEYIIALIILPIITYTFVSCLFLNNNFIGKTFITIVSLGFVKFPGLIFSFSLEGFVWLIGMKILFLILGFALILIAVFLALVICMPLSVISYPFAIKKSYLNPELTENFNYRRNI